MKITHTFRHSRLQVEKRERERFRLSRPPRIVCDDCGQAFASADRARKHFVGRDVHHQAKDAAESEANRRFHPVSRITAEHQPFDRLSE